MACLQDVLRGRDNNLNLVRAVAATGVLVSHAWPIALGTGTPEPLSRLSGGMTLGTACVVVFFAISGFLITASWDRSRAVGPFLRARVLRLWPGLAVSLALVALVMAPLVADRPAAAQIADPGTWTFLLRNLLLVSPQYTLPEVFEGNPYPAVEGSIWTLVHEVACYAGVLALGVAGLLADRNRMRWSLVALFAAWLLLVPLASTLHPKLVDLHRLSLPFLMGGALYAWRDRVPMNGAAALLALVAALSAGHVLSEPAAHVLRCAGLLYATFWIGYVPAGRMRLYNRAGDYSYGIYIYAFPIQGLVVWAFGPQGPWTNVALSLPPTLLLAALSWHLVEKPALSFARPRARTVAA